MTEPRKVTLEEARQLMRNNPNASVVFRPDESLPEEQQYALVRNEG